MFLNIPPHTEPPTSTIEATTATTEMQTTTEATTTDAMTTEILMPPTQTPGQQAVVEHVDSRDTFKRENLHEFRNFMATRENFFHEILVMLHLFMWSAYHSTKIFSTKSSLPTDPQKFSPSKVPSYTVHTSMYAVHCRYSQLMLHYFSHLTISYLYHCLPHHCFWYCHCWGELQSGVFCYCDWIRWSANHHLADGSYGQHDHIWSSDNW